MFKGKPLVRGTARQMPATASLPATALYGSTLVSCVQRITFPPLLKLANQPFHPALRLSPSAPQAVCHSASAHGTGEVSTCNYEARAFGVRSGMMIRWDLGFLWCVCVYSSCSSDVGAGPGLNAHAVMARLFAKHRSSVRQPVLVWPGLHGTCCLLCLHDTLHRCPRRIGVQPCQGPVPRPDCGALHV